MRRHLTTTETLRRVHDIKRVGLDTHYSEYPLSAVLTLLDDLADDLAFGIEDPETTPNGK